MATVYSRKVPEDIDEENLDRTIEHVRDTIRSMVSPDDDPNDESIEVRITTESAEGKIKILGECDQEPVADYLRPDFDPDEDAYDKNPLHEDVELTHLDDDSEVRG